MGHPRIIVWYDPHGRIAPMREGPPEIKQALLDIPEDVEGRDIYEIARKLAELLLEQVS